MEDDRAKFQKEIKLFREIQLELGPKSTKEMFSKENVSKLLGFLDPNRTLLATRGFRVEEQNLQDHSEILMVDPPKLERYEAWLLARQRPSRNFTCEATNLVVVMVNVSKLFGFLNPNRTLLATRGFRAEEKNLQDHP
ncbi:hypothetical protein RYX36_032399 [Vicia faba]